MEALPVGNKKGPKTQTDIKYIKMSMFHLLADNRNIIGKLKRCFLVFLTRVSQPEACRTLVSPREIAVPFSLMGLPTSTNNYQVRPISETFTVILSSSKTTNTSPNLQLRKHTLEKSTALPR